MRIANKRQMQNLLNAGVLGNTQRMWSAKEFFSLFDSDYNATFALRSYTPGKTFWPWLTVDECNCLIWQLSFAGEERDYYVQEVASPSHIVLAGEIGIINGTLVLEYSRVKEMMRDALQKERIHVTGAKARCILMAVADRDDYEDLMLLCESYPEHVVEFTIFDCYMGIYQRRLTIWEVRYY